MGQFATQQDRCTEPPLALGGWSLWSPLDRKERLRFVNDSHDGAKRRSVTVQNDRKSLQLSNRAGLLRL